MASSGVGIALWVLCSWVSGVAHAQVHDDEARGLYLAGAAAYEEGRFEESLAYFQRSYELSPRPELLYNIGQAADRSREDAIALDAFRRYLAAMPELPNRVALEGRIRVLEAAVARGTSAAPPDSEPIAETEPPTPVVSAVPAPEAVVPPAPEPTAEVDAGPGPDAGGIVLVVLGAAVAAGGAVLVGIGVPDSGAVGSPRPEEVFYSQALDRQNTGIAMAWSGVAAIGVGVVLAVIGAIVLGTSGSGEDESASLDAQGLRVRF